MKCDPKSLYITLQDFPHGSCGDAALLLAKYFENNKCGEFQYVLGDRNGHSHAWLQNGNIIADITADQFKDQNSPVIITCDHSWHSSFDGEIQHVADFEIYDRQTVLMLKASYNKIVNKIST